MKHYIPSTQKVVVENYPYGYKLRTTLYDTIEFSPKHGFRHVTQTINPKNGRLNAPKKSTYSPIIVRYYDEKGHIDWDGGGFNGDEEINRACPLLAETFLMFTPEQITYLYNLAFVYAIQDMKANVVYRGSKLEALKPLYEDFINAAKEGISTGANVWGKMKLDTAAIDALQVPDFNPFRTTTMVSLSSLAAEKTGS